MTFLGFIVAVLIIGGVFYAWYAYAGRTRENNDAQDRNATAQGAGRMRTSTAMETGTIGELPEDEQDAYAERSAVNNGSIPRNVLNPDHGYHVEAGTIGDVDDVPQVLSAYPDEANALVNAGSNIHTTGDTAGGAAGQTSVAANTKNATTKTDGAENLNSAIHQAFREEFYQMDDTDKSH